MVSLKALRKDLKSRFFNSSDIDIIICDTLKIDKSRLYFDLIISEEQLREINEKVLRLKAGEPVSYITGHCEFMSLDFLLNSETLIPRADTEILVEEVIRFWGEKPVHIFEIGTGSGCISVSLAHYLKNAKITACDISPIALDKAKENASRNNVLSRITFMKHDIMKNGAPLSFEVDCIVSNPPYIESETIKTLDKSVREFEPQRALDGGADGLDFYRKIISENNLRRGGLLAFEIGYNQGEAIKALMQSGFYNIEIKKDLAGRDRVALGIKK